VKTKWLKVQEQNQEKQNLVKVRVNALDVERVLGSSVVMVYTSVDAASVKSQILSASNAMEGMVDKASMRKE